MAQEQRAHTFLNCTWAEQRMPVPGPLWLDAWRSQWYCLALSEIARRPVDVQPDLCATCPYWQQRAELSRDSP